jgi:hypothetical protein
MAQSSAGGHGGFKPPDAGVFKQRHGLWRSGISAHHRVSAQSTQPLTATQARDRGHFVGGAGVRPFRQLGVLRYFNPVGVITSGLIGEDLSGITT